MFCNRLSLYLMYIIIIILYNNELVKILSGKCEIFRFGNYINKFLPAIAFVIVGRKVFAELFSKSDRILFTVEHTSSASE